MPELPAPHAPVASPSSSLVPFAPLADRPVPDALPTLRAPLADAIVPLTDAPRPDAPVADAPLADAPLADAQVAALFEAAPTGLAFFDREGRFVRVNAAFTAMHGRRSVADHLGRRPAELDPELARLEAMLQRVLDTGRAVHGHEWDALETTGRAYRATYFPVPGPSDDGPAGVGVIVEDVTTARIAALDREFLLELSAALQLAADSAGVAASALSRVAARLGLTRCALYEITDAAAAHCRHAWAAEGLDGVGEGAALPAEGFAALFEEALAGRVSVHPDPRHDPALPPDVRALCIVPLLRQGRLAAALVATDRRARRWTVRERGLLRTVAERVWPPFEAARLLEAEQRARVAAESANVAKSRFLATMSHELRTPLNAIAGHAELLQMGLHGPVTTAQEDALARIQRSQRHLLALIDDVLQYARLEGGRMTYRLAPIALGDAAHEAVRLVAPVARARDIALDVAPAPSPADVAVGDAEKVRQIAHILLSNAIKFTPPGGRIAVAVAPADPADGTDARVALRVADTGLGIAADRLADVFAPFVQVDGALTRTREGTGLGLAIARDLARGMGGELTVDSAPGVGSAFTLLLPPPGSGQAHE